MKVSSAMKELTLGLDINMDRVESLSQRELVGKLSYSKKSYENLLIWVRETWKPIVGYTSIINILVNNWLHLHFISAADLELILERAWVGVGSLWLQRWLPSFFPRTDP